MLAALKPQPPAQSLHGCHLQVVQGVSARREAIMHDGTHAVRAVLSHGAARALDQDEGGVATRALLGHVVAPTAAIVVVDMVCAPPAATLVLTGLRVFSDARKQRPAGEPRMVDRDPEVLNALRAQIGRELAQFAPLGLGGPQDPKLGPIPASEEFDALSAAPLKGSDLPPRRIMDDIGDFTATPPRPPVASGGALAVQVERGVPSPVPQRRPPAAHVSPLLESETPIPLISPVVPTVTPAVAGANCGSDSEATYSEIEGGEPVLTEALRSIEDELADAKDEVQAESGAKNAGSAPLVPENGFVAPVGVEKNPPSNGPEVWGVTFSAADAEKHDILDSAIEDGSGTTKKETGDSGKEFVDVEELQEEFGLTQHYGGSVESSSEEDSKLVNKYRRSDEASPRMAAWKSASESRDGEDITNVRAKGREEPPASQPVEDPQKSLEQVATGAGTVDGQGNEDRGEAITGITHPEKPSSTSAVATGSTPAVNASDADVVARAKSSNVVEPETPPGSGRRNDSVRSNVDSSTTSPPMPKPGKRSHGMGLLDEFGARADRLVSGKKVSKQDKDPASTLTRGSDVQTSSKRKRDPADADKVVLREGTGPTSNWKRKRRTSGAPLSPSGRVKSKIDLIAKVRESMANLRGMRARQQKNPLGFALMPRAFMKPTAPAEAHGSRDKEDEITPAANGGDGGGLFLVPESAPY